MKILSSFTHPPFSCFKLVWVSFVWQRKIFWIMLVLKQLMDPIDFHSKKIDRKIYSNLLWILFLQYFHLQYFMDTLWNQKQLNTVILVLFIIIYRLIVVNMFTVMTQSRFATSTWDAWLMSRSHYRRFKILHDCEI